jgi:hypothetical protein
VPLLWHFQLQIRKHLEVFAVLSNEREPIFEGVAEVREASVRNPYERAWVS